MKLSVALTPGSQPVRRLQVICRLAVPLLPRNTGKREKVFNTKQNKNQEYTFKESIGMQAKTAERITMADSLGPG